MSRRTDPSSVIWRASAMGLYSLFDVMWKLKIIIFFGTGHNGGSQTICHDTYSSVASHCKRQRNAVAQTKSHYLCSGPAVALVDVRIIITIPHLFGLVNISSDHRCFSPGIFGWSPSLCHTLVEELTLMRMLFNLVRYDPFTVTAMN